MTITEYLDLLTSAWRQKPKFTAMVASNVSVSARVQELLDSMIPLFDVDTAVGDQLDIIGAWVGVSRRVFIPLENVYFTWDGDALLGWDSGSWALDTDPGSLTILPDGAYRILIKAKIAANQWDGTTDGAYAVWDALFRSSAIMTTDDGLVLTTDDGTPIGATAGITILIKDNQDMSYDLGFVGGTVDAVTLALVLGGYIPLKPEGVRLAGVFTAANDGPLFAWDVESDFLQGWDEGSWVNEYTIA